MLAVLSWQPMLALLGAFCLLPPLMVTSFARRRRTIVLASLFPGAVVLVFCGLSYQYTLTLLWQPMATSYQANSQCGHLIFFRFHGGDDRPDFPALAAYSDPIADHWSTWPGFHSEEFIIRVPGVEFARSGYLVHIIEKTGVDGMEIFMLSYWMVLAIQTFVLGITLIVARSRRATASPL